MKGSQSESSSAEGQVRPWGRDAGAEEFDVGLLEDSLAKTPWQRMQANDDALQLAEALREAMERRDAKS